MYCRSVIQLMYCSPGGLTHISHDYMRELIAQESTLAIRVTLRYCICGYFIDYLIHS